VDILRPRKGAADAPTRSPQVTLSDLFWGFAKIGLSGFGGVMPWARRALVDERRWLTAEDFISLLGLCQFLPGPNVINLAICVGRRFQGARGAVAASLGLVLAPLCIIIALSILYDRYGELPAIRAILRGISAVGAGLIIALGLRMAFDLRKRPELLLVAAATFIAIAILRWPLPAVMLGLAPLSVWAAARWSGRP
jgi:chromate transporter